MKSQIICEVFGYRALTHTALEILHGHHDSIFISGFARMNVESLADLSQILKRVIAPAITQLLWRRADLPSQPSPRLRGTPDQLSCCRRAEGEVENLAVFRFEHDRFYAVAHHLARTGHRPKRVHGI
jgi:hypothetical protein